MYEIDYKFYDELQDSGSRTGLVIVYETGTPSGDTLQHALDCANEDGDFSGVDKLLLKMFDVRDDDVVFYYDLSDMEDTGTSRQTKLAVELQNSFDIVVNDIGIVSQFD